MEWFFPRNSSIIISIAIHFEAYSPFSGVFFARPFSCLLPKECYTVPGVEVAYMNMDVTVVS